MNKGKLNFKSVLKEMKNQDNFIVYWSPFNGQIRNKDGDDIGSITTRIMDKLLASDLLIESGKGTGLLDHETYYRLK